MADKVVEVPGVGNVAFPDTMSDDQIAAHIQSHASGQPAAEPASVGGFLKNTLHSAGNFVGDLAGPLLHPAKTLEGLTGLAEGMAEKSGFSPVNGHSHQQYVDGLVKMYSDRYGSFENFRKTLYEDPVGVLSDVAALASAGGGLAKGAELAADAAKLPQIAGAAGKVADVANTVSHATNPLSLAGKAAEVAGATKVADNFADWAAGKLQRGSLRAGFDVNTDAAKVAGAVDAKRAGNIPFSDQGLQDITAGLMDLQRQKNKLTGAARSPVDPNAVETRLDEVASRRGTQVNPQSDVKQVERVRSNFRELTGGSPVIDPATGKQMRDASGVPVVEPGKPIPADQAEALKEGTYANNKYGSAAPPNLQATAEAEKALARGLKEELERQMPELTGINADQSKLLDLKGIMGKAINKYTNSGGFLGNLAKNTVTTKEGALKMGGLVGAGAALHEPVVGAGVALMQAVLSDPAVKSRLAQAIDWGRKAKVPAAGAISKTANGLARVNEYIDSLKQ